MTESMKIAEIHRTNIDYERQRHLVNWLIKSGPHMNATTAATATNSTVSAAATGASNSQHHHHQQQQQQTHPAAHAHAVAPNLIAHHQHQHQPPTAAGYYVTAACKPPHDGHHPHHTSQASASLAPLSRSTFFNSQTNLPLHIMSGSGADGAQPKLRRFNSHDTSANMFSVADFENARMARRNEMEIKQRQQQQQYRYKMNSLSSGTGDCSTGDSKGSKFSSDSSSDPMPAERFLDRFALPCVVRCTISTHSASLSDGTIQSSSSNGSSGIGGGGGGGVSAAANGPQNKGELCMLYRQVKNRKIYHGTSAKSSASRKKGVMIPQEYQGFFSMVTEKGAASATQYTTLVQLVRECVYKFLSVDNMPAYTEQQSSDFPPRVQYVKATAHGGQVYRLLAVFEDGKQDTSAGSSAFNAATAAHNHKTHENGATSLNTTASSNNGAAPVAHHQHGSNIFRDKEKGRYAQLLNEQRQVMYVSLTAKGKFYEIESATPQIFQKSAATNNNASHSAIADPAIVPSVAALSTTRKTLNPDCVYRLDQILTGPSAVTLPINVRLIAAPAPQGGSVPVPEYLAITHITSESILIVCPIDSAENGAEGRAAMQQLRLQKRQLGGSEQASTIHFAKCLLGFETEQKMFLNPTVQTILKYCQCNVSAFLRQVQAEVLQFPKQATFASSVGGVKPKSDGMKILKPLNFPRLLRREKSTIAHEKEDSIIFLSKNDLENMDQQQKQQQLLQLQLDEERLIVSLEPLAHPPVSAKKKWFRRQSSTSNSVPPAAAPTATAKCVSTADLMLDAQSKRMSLDRYQDMSKLLHERFGDEVGDRIARLSNNLTELLATPASDASTRHPATATTTTSTRPCSELGGRSDATCTGELRKKSMSMQDMQQPGCQSHPDPDEQQQTTSSAQPDLVRNAAGHRKQPLQQRQSLTNFAQQQQQPPPNSEEPPQSFISAKLFSEFHVKTKQHSKSATHLHNLLHFSVPHKMNVNEMRRDDGESAFAAADDHTGHTDDDSWLPAAVPANRVQTTTIEDDMPYSNVRDSLVIQPMPASSSANCVHFTRSSQRATTTSSSATSVTSVASAASQPENIYAEICSNGRCPGSGQQQQQQMAPPPQAATVLPESIYSTIDLSANGGLVNSRPAAMGSTIRISVPAIRSPLMASVVGVQHQPQ